MARPGYRLLDHTADIAFEVEASDWPGLLVAATAALGDLTLEEDGRPAVEERPIAVSGADREDVLVAWLTEAVVAVEEDGFLPRSARAVSANEIAATGVLLGRRLDLATERVDRVVKAVTYHDLHVAPGTPGQPWRATVVLDL